MALSLSLDTVPTEVLEHIAFFAATEGLLGPPSLLCPLLATSRSIHDRLSIASNHHLYARIFSNKFDTDAAMARLGEERLSPTVLAHELKRRCLFLKRIRQRIDSTLHTPAIVTEILGYSLEELLFQAYLMMTENVWKNERQLREYAKLDTWLRQYWFDELGASRAISSMRRDVWPPNDSRITLAMWLFWFMLRSVDYSNDSKEMWTALNTLRVFALAAHKYSLTAPPWIDFLPRSYSSNPTKIEYYGKMCDLTPPPLATPAILSFLTLVNKLPQGPTTSIPLPPSDGPALSNPVNEWSCELYRCLSLGSGEFDTFLTKSFKPGSLEGVWEGLFTYTEFTAYAALLAGAPPPILQRSTVVRHQQTWKLREHHLLASSRVPSDTDVEHDSSSIEALAAGDPLRSYFPTGTQISEFRDGIEVREPGNCKSIWYRRLSAPVTQSSEEGNGQEVVLDIIITGEGHSAWGQFNLVGRVRPCDGFISLSKEYVDGDRGKWLYRGYLVGNSNGSFAGRWRDTLSPADVPGYEGCFAMSRRR